MVVLSCAYSAYPTHAVSLRAHRGFSPVRSTSPVSVSHTHHHHHHHDHPFVPEVEKAVDSLYSEFRAVDNLVACNTARVLRAFQNARVGSHHFGDSTGYGHKDAGGREALDQAFAEIFGAESAIVRSQFFSGTHAISCALFAFLRPGHELLAVAGAPYDTLEEVIGIRDSRGLGSLKDFGVKYREVPGADLIAGSLIKNPGGTIAPCGGYVAGKGKWVNAAAARLSAPGLGIDCGSIPGDIMRAFFQGLFLSPQMVGEAIKGSFLIAEVMAAKGHKVQPLPRVPRHDTVQVIFADGTFIDGSTSELSCDGPLREPFAVYCQGGTHWTQWGLVLGDVLKSI